MSRNDKIVLKVLVSLLCEIQAKWFETDRFILIFRVKEK